jgi:hypothetical protein
VTPSPSVHLQDKGDTPSPREWIWASSGHSKGRRWSKTVQV